MLETTMADAKTLAARVRACADALPEFSLARRELLASLDELIALIPAGDPSMKAGDGFYTWEHDALPARVARPEDADFASGDPRWVRGFPVQLYLRPPAAKPAIEPPHAEIARG
jgi:hypothetical protein